MLRQIPFYGSLLKQDLGKGRKSTNAHVLVYGAIEVHAMGPKGCITSNSRLAEETGYSVSRVQTILSEMNTAGWISVHMNNGKRVEITPNAYIKFEGGLPSAARGVAVSGNIGNSLGNNSVRDENSSFTKSRTTKIVEDKDAELSNSFSGAVTELPKAIPLSFNGSPRVVDNSTPVITTKKLFYDVCRKYSLVIPNHTHVPKWCNDLDSTYGEETAQKYLTRLLERDLNAEALVGEFVPVLTTGFDVLNKSGKVIQYFARTKDLTGKMSEFSGTDEKTGKSYFHGEEVTSKNQDEVTEKWLHRNDPK